MVGRLYIRCDLCYEETRGDVRAEYLLRLELDTKPILHVALCMPCRGKIRYMWLLHGTIPEVLRK